MALRNIFSKAARNASGAAKSAAHEASGAAKSAAGAASGAAKSAASAASKAASAIPQPSMPTMPADLAASQHKAQEKAAKALRAARAAYKRDGSTRKAIAAYEQHVRANPSGAQWPAEEYLFLSELYVKRGSTTDAWDYLNEVMVARPDLSTSIRKEQVRILKKEKRYEEALILHSSYAYLVLAQTHHFTEDDFVKDARSIGSKLGLSETKLRALAAQVLKKSKGQMKEPDFTKLVKGFLSDNAY